MTIKFSSQFMPYAIEEISDGKFVILNRNYKPIGLPNGVWYEYENFSISINLTKKEKRLFITQDHAPNIFWLYDELTNPFIYKTKENMKKYLSRYELLFQKEIL